MIINLSESSSSLIAFSQRRTSHCSLVGYIGDDVSGWGIASLFLDLDSLFTGGSEEISSSFFTDLTGDSSTSSFTSLMISEAGLDLSSIGSICLISGVIDILVRTKSYYFAIDPDDEATELFS